MSVDPVHSQDLSFTPQMHAAASEQLTQLGTSANGDPAYSDYSVDLLPYGMFALRCRMREFTAGDSDRPFQRVFLFRGRRDVKKLGQVRIDNNGRSFES